MALTGTDDVQAVTVGRAGARKDRDVVGLRGAGEVQGGSGVLDGLPSLVGIVTRLCSETPVVLRSRVGAVVFVGVGVASAVVGVAQVGREGHVGPPVGHLEVLHIDPDGVPTWLVLLDDQFFYGQNETIFLSLDHDGDGWIIGKIRYFFIEVYPFACKLMSVHLV